MQLFEDFCNAVTTRGLGSRLSLKIGSLFFVYGNLVAFLLLFSIKSLPLISEAHSTTFMIFYCALVYLSTIHAVYLYEHARGIDAGTPEKISTVHSSGTSPNPLSQLSLDELCSFSPAFRSLVSHREKGYISLMHV